MRRWVNYVLFMPDDFRLLASGNDRNLLEGSHIKEDKRTLAARFKNTAKMEKPVLSMLEVMLEKIKTEHGVIAEYLWCTYAAVRGRPLFLIDEVKNIKTEVYGSK